jgi:ABC-2 type transport system permease protein
VAVNDLVELRPVHGPSALGGGWRRFWALLFLMAVSEFKKSYFETVLGYAWSLLRPLMLFGVLLVVFTQIFRIGSDEVAHYPVFLLLNIVLFSFFQESTTVATPSVVAQEGIVRKTQFPRLVIPMAVVLTGLFNLGTNLLAVLIFVLAFGVEPTWTWMLLPVILLAMLVITCAVSTYLSALYVRRRDVAIIWSVFSSALFYGSAVLYPISIVDSESLRHILFCNPLVPLFTQTNKWIIDNDAPSAVAAAGGWAWILPSIVISLAICVAAVWFFNREAPRVAEEL